jgi:deazaflavin-dependent oxidoreductase (nitroreductase family)
MNPGAGTDRHSDLSDPVPLTVAELARLTAEVADPAGPGAAAVTKAFNATMVHALRQGVGRVDGELADVDLLVMTTTGRSSGRRIPSPLGWFEIDGRLLVIASMGGADRNPNWYHNVRADPSVLVELLGETFEARAVPTEGADRDALYAEICRRSAVFSDYQARTTRVIPVVEILRSEPTSTLGNQTTVR